MPAGTVKKKRKKYRRRKDRKKVPRKTRNQTWGRGTVPILPKPAEAPQARLKRIIREMEADMVKHPPHSALFPAGTVTPNMAGRMLGITGEAVKQWIYQGKLRAAKLHHNGYYAIRVKDLAEVICGIGEIPDFKLRKNKKAS